MASNELAKGKNHHKRGATTRGSFGRLVELARRGDESAIARIKWHVRRRLNDGWRPETIMKRLRVRPHEFVRYREANMAPRLVKPDGAA
jgi:hypothetical protein